MGSGVNVGTSVGSGVASGSEESVSSGISVGTGVPTGSVISSSDEEELAESNASTVSVEVLSDTASVTRLLSVVMGSAA